MPETRGPERPGRPLLVLAATSVFGVLGYATMATVLLTDSRSLPNPPAPPLTWALPVVSAPVSIEPAPSTTPLASRPRLTAPRTNQAGAGTHHGSPTRHAVAPTRSSATPAPQGTPIGLAIGTTVGLGLPAMPGYRLRHRDFVARVDAITAASSLTDRMDTRFVVRAGRADPGCVSFESDNFPGFFLRHRDFALRLDQASGTALFDRDATFCPVAVNGGTALRSVNYPDRYLVVAAGRIRLEQTPVQQATVFQVLAPL
ncbi:hypothetical protein GCM10010168_19350 [Actinoplanes ianthinogenes]|uniref:Alpha-L-arabinofuranosidase B arabinose-binding domain-containing protein n=1 Tax=Actinoplanes ianthinogenes TaxID=122358 RepID=A0ABM7M7D1_9ACTN|nr:AbfB domain-containing protein [Actinoplanes ianthinogenes]BCJ47577.1 hypothetical protein Aiant_82340 [Actinoplanes ianthinogenes]GGR02724.1 hypothetical protein GCM10010168_19350 [Actinoplanes ianthinogenes]